MDIRRDRDRLSAALCALAGPSLEVTVVFLHRYLRPVSSRSAHAEQEIVSLSPWAGTGSPTSNAALGMQPSRGAGVLSNAVGD